MPKRSTSLWAGTVIGLLGIIAFHGTRSLGDSPSTATPQTALGAPAPKKTAVDPLKQSSSSVETKAGPLVNYGYGSLSVKVTVTGTKITAVTLASLSTEESFSQSVADSSLPILRTEVLDTQSASISAVSGATYTSDAYINSLQHALDRLHFS